MSKSTPIVEVKVGGKVIFEFTRGYSPHYTGDALEILQARYHLKEALETLESVLHGVAIGANELPGPNH